MPETDVSDGSTLTQPELWPFSNQQTTLSQMCQKNYPCNGEGTPKMPKGEVYSLVGVSLSTDWSLKPVFVKGMKSVCLCAVFLFLHSPLLFLPFSWAIVQSGGELAASLNLCSPKARHSCKHFAHGFFFSYFQGPQLLQKKFPVCHSVRQGRARSMLHPQSS